MKRSEQKVTIKDKYSFFGHLTVFVGTRSTLMLDGVLHFL